MSYRNNIRHAGMDYLTEVACELICSTKGCKNKKEVVSELYYYYMDAKASEKEMVDLIKNYKEDQAYIEEYLLAAVYAEKILSWEDIQYCHDHLVLPKSVREKPFPIDELKQELLEKGYTLTNDKENEIEM